MVRASRGLTAGITDRRSASNLKAALARRRDWLSGATPPTTQPSATVNLEVAPPDDMFPPSESGLVRPTSPDEDGESAVSSPARRREEALVRDALTARGIRYRWGGSSRGGFDCSGFTRYMMARNMGIQLPHSASGQARYGRKVGFEELHEGDLVFFRTTRRSISHVGIYVGDNRFIHAPRSGRSVTVEPMTGYYRRRYVTARRLARAAPPG